MDLDPKKVTQVSSTKSNQSGIWNTNTTKKKKKPQPTTIAKAEEYGIGKE
jgi:hypothetical protein